MQIQEQLKGRGVCSKKGISGYEYSSHCILILEEKIKAAGVSYNLDEHYEDYQKIYDKTVEKQ